MGSAAKPYPIRSRNRIKFRNLLKRVFLKMIVYALFFILAVESWAQDFDVASDASAIGNTTTSPVDPIEQLRQIVEEHTKAIASSRQEMNETVKGMSFCQTGMTGCSSCGGKDEAWGGDTVTPVSYEVTFPKEFPGTPDVTSALNEIYQAAPGKADGYGWRITANNVTSSSFTLLIELIDRNISKFYANWIACYTL